jgi:hypothetical protein
MPEYVGKEKPVLLWLGVEVVVGEQRTEHT